MKKLAIITMAVLVSVALVMPSLATELQINGHMRARGFYNSNADNALTKDSSSDAYYDFRFRPELVFKVNDNIEVHSRVAVFDEKFGEMQHGSTSDSNGTGRNFSNSDDKGDTAKWDRGWMVIKTQQFGTFHIGRMLGGFYGLDLFDNELTADRIKLSYDINENLSLLALTEKYQEKASDNTDLDKNAYAVAATYKAGDITAGLLIQQVTDENSTSNLGITYLDPFFKGEFKNVGPFEKIGVNAEIKYATGSIEYKDNVTLDDDRSGLGYYLAVNGVIGPATIELGYASAGGDDPTTADEDESLISSLGSEWTPFVVLQDANALVDNAKTGGIATDSSKGNSAGIDLFYLQADYKLSDAIKLTGLIGMASANEVANNIEDDFGTEIDAKLEWKLMDGLTYEFNFGYLLAGDYFKQGDTTKEVDDTFTAFHKLEIEF